MKRHTIKLPPCLVSIILHLMVLLLLVMYFDFSTTKVTLGHADIHVVDAYVYHHSDTQTDAHSKLGSKHVQPSVSRRQSAVRIQQPALVKNSHKAAFKSDNNNVKVAEQKNAVSTGKTTSELIALLHAAIQTQQHYPSSALQMEREGKATVMFTLYPDGAIKDLQIVKSSGTTSLDEAAIAAVNDAAPFQRVDKYLQNYQVFILDVAFELA